MIWRCWAGWVSSTALDTVAGRSASTASPGGARADGCAHRRWGRADGIEITALKTEGDKGTPGPPDKRSRNTRPRHAAGTTTDNDWRHGVPPTWLLAQAREGRIPHHRLGHYVRFNPDDLREWLRENRIDAPANGFRPR